MNFEKILNEQLEKIKPTKKEIEELKKKADNFCDNINHKIRERKIKADVFIGGSLAKGTILKKERYPLGWNISSNDIKYFHFTFSYVAEGSV